jgi:hypothetical protein
VLLSPISKSRTLNVDGTRRGFDLIDRLPYFDAVLHCAHLKVQARKSSKRLHPSDLVHVDQDWVRAIGACESNEGSHAQTIDPGSRPRQATNRFGLILWPIHSPDA